MAEDRGSEHAGTVRWHQQLFLWSCHLYYVEDKPVLDDTSFDATIRCLELNRELWSRGFHERMRFLHAEKDLKSNAHAVRLIPSEIEDAHTWAGYVTFLRRFQ